MEKPKTTKGKRKVDMRLRKSRWSAVLGLAMVTQVLNAATCGNPTPGTWSG